MCRFGGWRWKTAVGPAVLAFVFCIGTKFGGTRIWVLIESINCQTHEFTEALLAPFFIAYLANRRAVITRPSWRLGAITLPQPRELIPLVAGELSLTGAVPRS